MSDVRSLLRQQRAARRIEHPYAVYSDAGKLLCTLCHEHIKTESLWDSHVRGEAHKTRLIKVQTAASSNARASQQQTSQKRKHDDNEEAIDDKDGDVEMDDGRRKRNKTDGVDGMDGDGDRDNKDQTLTPPRLTRRTSTTPSQGVEIQIPSRPATPAHRDGSSSSTPGGQLNNLVSQSTTASLPSRQASSLTTDERLTSAAAIAVDEAEWAAFEADIAATTATYDEDATISAPAMTAEQAAAADAQKEEEAEKRRAQADVDLEDEKEEATRALEEEFEEMEELEARVKRLKDKREALRKRGESFSQENGTENPTSLGKENLDTPAIEEKEEDDDDEDDDEEDEWDGFRFRTA
ncbi:coiled-coil 16 [Fusarium subglutinans]|uniref:Coiled-coil 16 n=1 Tax=Gibberella subglutinans TaxID=42677 RepID=A0A8H5L1I3_GIBSU|nr:coiled-coil 16 [Fusarium subglutinans]KAF5583258.1 coiled-coil 16 [Fusarium subglutinans]